jgi:replicative DNA helicase
VRNAEHYCDIVGEKSQLRRVERLGKEMASFAGEGKRPLREILDWSSNRFLELLEGRGEKPYAAISDASAEFSRTYSETYDDKSLPGIPSGYSELDKLLLGFQPGNLIILAARPSQGKTSLALDFAREVAARGKSVAFVSLEMSKEEIVIRMLCAAGGLDAYRLKLKRLSDKRDSKDKTDWDRLKDGMDVLSTLKVFIDDTSALTLTELRARVKTIALEQGLDLVIIDYLQMIDGELGGEFRVQEVSRISRGLKALARELQVPVIALSQLSRNIERREGHKKVPQLSDLRESGSIEQDADVVMFIHRELSEDEEREQYDFEEVEDTQLIIAKNRNGEVGKIQLEFLRKYATFKLSTEPAQRFSRD